VIKRVFVLPALAIALPVSAVAQPSTFAGFWKVRCTDAFGVQIQPVNERLWSVSFCGVGGCFGPGQWAPNTTITGDPDYKVIDPRTIEFRGARYTKCTSDPNPKLDYSTMQGEPSREIHYVDMNKGLPDYDAHTPFTEHDSRVVAALREVVNSVKAGDRQCVAGSVAALEEIRVKLYSNVCDERAVRELKRLVARLAPTLHQGNLSFWVMKPTAMEGPDLLVEHFDLSSESYPFLSLWRIRFNGDSYSLRYAGPFLEGRILAVRPFAGSARRSIVFVQHLSCFECEPTVYVTPMDFEADNDARPYEFTYSEKHDSFDPTLEYQLPAMGHTVDAKVETRLLPPSTDGPHVLQHFHMLEPGRPDEWWTFTCKGYRCDYKLHKGSATSDFLRVWGQAKKL
jgi:hypothetical protein